MRPEPNPNGPPSQRGAPPPEPGPATTWAAYLALWRALPGATRADRAALETAIAQAKRDLPGLIHHGWAALLRDRQRTALLSPAHIPSSPEEDY